MLLSKKNSAANIMINSIYTWNIATKPKQYKNKSLTLIPDILIDIVHILCRTKTLKGMSIFWTNKYHKTKDRSLKVFTNNSPYKWINFYPIIYENNLGINRIGKQRKSMVSIKVRLYFCLPYFCNHGSTSFVICIIIVLIYWKYPFLSTNSITTSWPLFYISIWLPP